MFVVLILLLVASSCSFAGILDAELALFGGSKTAVMSNPVGGSVGGVVVDSDDKQFTDMGSKITAGLLSLILPGAGQYYNGDVRKAYIFAGAEAGIWSSYYAFHKQAQGREDDYKEYATLFADVTGSHAEEYWRAIGRYDNSDYYNEALLREARATGDEAVLIEGSDMWEWQNQDYRRGYQQLRADANRAYEHRDFTIAFVVINRAVAVWDAARSAGNDEPIASIGDYELDLCYSNSFQNPEAGWSLTKRF